VTGVSNTDIVQVPESDEGPCKPLDITIVTDSYPDETSWTVKNLCTGMTVASGGQYFDTFSSYSIQECLASDAEYEFVIEDSFGDGICCGYYGDGSFTVVYGAEEVKTGGNFAYLDSASFGGICPNE
jgi:hypothetical protein